jgi:uncharacterized protein involved in high-affinity Fe2+ transport
MEAANDWNSSFWMDELAKLADDKALRSTAANSKPTIKSTQQSENQNGAQVEVKLGELVDISDPSQQQEDMKFTVVLASSPIETQPTSRDRLQILDADNHIESDIELTKVESNNGTGNGVTINFTDLMKEEEQKNIKSTTTNKEDNAGNYPNRHSNSTQQATINFSEIKLIDSPVREKRKKAYNTTNITCTLHDLLLGVKSPVIRAAMDEIKEERRQLEAKKNRSRPVSTSSTIISFESLVQEQQNKLKNYNTNAKEFVPMYTKYAYSN